MISTLLLIASTAASTIPERVAETERLPKGATLEVSDDGTFRVNGIPRYLTATVFYGNTCAELRARTSGYPESLRWLYERLPDYEGMQRLGIDAYGFEAGRLWMKGLSNKAAKKWQAEAGIFGETEYSSIAEGQLPAYIDFTPAPWGHGGIVPKDVPDLPAEAFTVGDHHWVPYSIHHPDGRALWLRMWTEEAKRLQSVPIKPWCYELMNEPSVLDTGAYAKEKFKSTGRRDHPVEFLKFTDETYTSLIAEGVRAIKEIQPNARVTLQPVTSRSRGIDLYELSRVMDVMCSQTGGGGLVGAHLMRALADGKPIVDGETYVGKSAQSLRNALVTQFARGFNASYTFKWSRRPRDWARGGNAALEEPLARKLSDYYMLNPYLVPPETMNGFRLARREAQIAGELFLPRNRGTAHRVGVLYSRPTERLWHCYPNKMSLLEFDKVLSELEYAHLNPEVIFEEQLRDDPKRLNRYAVLVAPGVEAVYPTTPAAVRAWQQSGGVLIQVGERMSENEYGEPNGELYPSAHFIESKGVRSDELGRAIAEVAIRAGVTPSCVTANGSKIEVIDAARGDFGGWILISHALDPQLTRFRPTTPREQMVQCVSEIRDGRVVVVFRELLHDADGMYPLYLKPNEPLILIGGTRSAIEALIGSTEDKEVLSALSAQEAESAAKRNLDELRRAAQRNVRGFHPNRSRLQSVDLRRVANAKNLTDKWWGLHEVDGVSFDFIRTDQNFFKDTLALKSGEEFVEVDVNADVQHLFFNYFGEPAFVVKYADESEIAFVATAGEGETRRTWRWTNPYPTRRILKIACGAKSVASVLAAIELEAPANGVIPIGSDRVRSLRSLSGPKLEPVYTNGEVRLVHGVQPASWSCANLELGSAVEIPWKRYRLAMEVNRLPNRFGAEAQHPVVQLNLNMREGNGEKFRLGRFQTPLSDDGLRKFAHADGDSNSWETVWMDVDLSKRKEVQLTSIVFQYQGVGVDPGALAIRNLRLESVEETAP